MAEKHPTHVRSATEATSQTTLKIEQIIPAWRMSDKRARLSIGMRMDAVMKAAA